jgi:UDP-sulfoquinovose synthase
MKIIVAGGDGFVGWPVALRLSSEGHKVTIVDNFSRRSIDNELSCQSLTPIQLLADRLNCWYTVSGKRIAFKRVDLSRNYYGTFDVIKKISPDVIIHLAEQRAAPYSMKSATHRLYTVNNNTMATHNLLAAVVESGLDIHVIHIGSAGIYGYDGNAIPIPEGYIDYFVRHGGKEYSMKELYPMRPGSIYHMTKTMDMMMFRFYAMNDGLRITDLQQGIIWGVQTEETEMHKGLVNRLDYCGDYGTVLNRFLIQGVCKQPITLHGKGRQKRAFIHVSNTCDCISLAVNNPPPKNGQVEIFNQTTEQLRLSDLAELVSKITEMEVINIPNPRKEWEDNELSLDNNKFLSLGLVPIFVDENELEKIAKLIYQNRSNLNAARIPCRSYWTKENEDNCRIKLLTGRY